MREESISVIGNKMNFIILETFVKSFIVISVLPLGRFLASIFSTLCCFPPFSSIPHTMILLKTHSAYPLPNHLYKLKKGGTEVRALWDSTSNWP